MTDNRSPGTDDLLSCPFCGGEEISLHSDHGKTMFWASCRSCGLEAPTETGVTGDHAADYWNTRTRCVAQGPQVPAAWRYQRKEGWEDVWRYVTKPPNDFETLGDWTIQPLYAVPPSPVAGEEIGQHIAWLYQFVRCMNERNWRDMRDNAERQIDRLSSMITTRNLAESICDDCPPAGYPTDKTRCLVCPRRTSPIPSTEGK